MTRATTHKTRKRRKFRTEKARVDAFRAWAFRQFMKARYFPDDTEPLLKFAKALGVTARQQVTAEQLDVWEELMQHKANKTGPYEGLPEEVDDEAEDVDEAVSPPEGVPISDDLAERLRIRSEIDAMTSMLRTADSHVPCSQCGRVTLARNQWRKHRGRCLDCRD